MKTWIYGVVRGITASIDLQDIGFAAGLGLVAYGCGLVYLPAGYIVTGVLLLWVTVPARPFPIVFVRRGPAKERE